MSAHAYTLTFPSARVLNDVFGIDLIGRTSISEVVRTANTAAARRYVSTLSDNGRKVQLIPGVPREEGVCAALKTESVRCIVSAGRHVSIVVLPTLDQAMQAATAVREKMKAVGN